MSDTKWIKLKVQDIAKLSDLFLKLGEVEDLLEKKKLLLESCGICIQINVEQTACADPNQQQGAVR
jgi:hypothetical protein